MSELIFLKSESEAQKWFKKNHLKLTQQWFGLNKKNPLRATIEASQLKDIALCFGWTGIIIKSIDYNSYRMLYMKRKAKNTWSLQNIQRFKELSKMGLIQPQGRWAFDNRDKKKSEKSNFNFSNKQIDQFKKNKIAWTFFKSQTPSYQKYMTQWVTSAVRVETQSARLAELIFDSGNESKLGRVLKSQNKIIENKKNRYKIGETPIEEAKNLGPVTGAEFRSVGISTVEQLKSLGWEKSISMWISHYPHRIHMMAVYAVIGAVFDQSFRELDPELKAEAKAFIKEFKSDFRN